MTAQEKANKLISMNEIMVLAEIGYKLTGAERKGIAKRQAIETCNEVISNIEPSVSMDVISARIKYWEQVKEEIEKL
jgi:hypothetical protein